VQRACPGDALQSWNWLRIAPSVSSLRHPGRRGRTAAAPFGWPLRGERLDSPAGMHGRSWSTSERLSEGSRQEEGPRHAAPLPGEGVLLPAWPWGGGSFWRGYSLTSSLQLHPPPPGSLLPLGLTGCNVPCLEGNTGLPPHLCCFVPTVLQGTKEEANHLVSPPATRMSHILRQGRPKWRFQL